MWRRAGLTRGAARGTIITLGTTLGIVLTLTACADSDDTTAERTETIASPVSSPIPVVIDYSPTISDVGALLYLAEHPSVDLQAITIAGTGESRCARAVSNTLALLDEVGRGSVPVACGPEEPVGLGHNWPADWRDAADALEPLSLERHDDPDVPGGAVGLLRQVAASADELRIVALGPLTNIATALAQDPGFADDVEMLVTMGGAFAVEGNAPNRRAEWNYYVDPTSVDVVVRSGLPVTMVPLDATNALPADHGWFERLNDSPDAPAAAVITDLWSSARPWEIEMYMWDELTAAVAIDPSLASTTTQRVTIAVDGPAIGSTLVDPDGSPISVAANPDRRAVEDELLHRLTGD